MQYVTEAHAAEMLANSVRTLQRWRIEGDGPPFVKFGRSVRYISDESPEPHHDSLQAYAARNTRRPEGAAS